jgi:hypothetical protein
MADRLRVLDAADTRPLDDAEHDEAEHTLRGAARVTPEREWFDLRRL